MTTEKLVILDFLIQDVTIHIYEIDSDIRVDENFITKLGYNPDFCQWYFGTKAEVIKHKEVITK